MKILFAAAAITLSLSAGAVLAQQTPNSAQPSPSTPPAPPAQADATPTPDAPPPPPPRAGPMGNDWRADWHRGHRPPPPPPSKAAHFRIEDGNVKVDVKCSDDEPMKACADEVNQILDRLAGSSSRYDDDR